MDMNADNFRTMVKPPTLQRQVACLILDGRAPAEIAQALYISRYTAKDHIKAIFRKTGTHSQPEITRCLTGHL